MDEENYSRAVPMQDLFGKYVVAVQPKKKHTSERTELIQYFFENAKAGWQGRYPLRPAYIATRLSHLSTQDLYAFKSQCEDRRRTGYPWGKYFFGALKAKV